MGPGRNRRLLVAAIAVVAFAVLPGFAAAQPSANFASTGGVLSGTTLSLHGDEQPEILGHAVLTGAIPIPGPGQTVTITVKQGDEPLLTQIVPANPASGRFKLRVKLTGCCDYTAQAAHGTDLSDPLGFEVDGPPTLEPGQQALLFNRLLEKAGYHMGDIADRYDSSTELAIIALRKANDLPISDTYAPRLFRMLLKGEARFEPVHDDDDRHVEVDLSRQVMALVDHGKATDVFHVSTGAFGTPTGEYSFYEKSPGYNAKGMYYSIYYSGNYATHGYASVPYYPASHGCVRNPEPYSIFIYDWIELGDKMYVYE